MSTALLIVLGLLVLVMCWNRAAAVEGFVTMPRRSDVGRACDGWAEEPGFERDLRFAETFTDIQGLGVATDFCRAIQVEGDPSTLHMACAVGRRDGMNTMEYRSRSVADGFRFSRDDYWRQNAGSQRMDYCRILRDPVTEEFVPICAIAGPDGFRKQEERDTAPPPHIRKLVRAYEGAMAWFRWVDDAADVTEQMTVVAGSGRPEFPSLLKPERTRGVQLNRIVADAAEQHVDDSLRFGQEVEGRAIGAVAFWIWRDGAAPVEPVRSTVWESSNGGGRKDRVWLGVEGGRWVFEVWDDEQRIMRMDGGEGSARTDTWQHVVVTTVPSASAAAASNSIDWWPTWRLWIDGVTVTEHKEGRRIPATLLTENRLGGPGMSGCLVDFRMYRRGLTSEDVADTMTWAKEVLHPSP